MEAGQPESDRGPKAREISMRTEGGVESSYTLSPFHAARRGEKPPAGRGPQGRPEGGHGGRGKGGITRTCGPKRPLGGQKLGFRLLRLQQTEP